jgi:hypothetical protein
MDAAVEINDGTAAFHVRSDAPPDQPPPTTNIPQPDQGPPGAANAQPAPSGYTMEELYLDFNTALNVVNDFWATHWNEYFIGPPYTPPYLVSGPLGAGIYDAPEEQVLCNRKPIPDGNAVYCGPPYDPSQDYVAHDMDLLLRARELGDALIYFVVAHEWGHAVAARLDATHVYEAYELQADCFAGAALQGAINDGTLLFEDGDPQEVAAGIESLADKLPWGSTRLNEQNQLEFATHGDVQERIDNYNLGVEQGVSACLKR